MARVRKQSLAAYYFQLVDVIESVVMESVAICSQSFQQLEVEEEEDEQAMGQEHALGEEPVA